MKKSHNKGSGHSLPVLKTKSEASQNPEQFALFMEAITTYVGTSFQEAADLDPLLSDPFNDPMPSLLNAIPSKKRIILEFGYESEDDVEKDMMESITTLFKENMKIFSHRQRIMRNNVNRLYELIWGQCSDALKAEVKGHQAYPKKKEDRDTMWLLQELKKATSGLSRNVNVYVSMFNLLRKFYSTKMKENESLESYHLRFESIVKTIRLNKGSFGKFQCLIEHETQSGNATDIQEAEDTVETSFLSVAFLLNADQRRYSGLITDLANRCLTGADDYPRDLPTAYDFLAKYKSSGNNFRARSNNRWRNSREERDRAEQPAINVTMAQTTSSTDELVPGRNGVTIKQAHCSKCNKYGHSSAYCPRDLSVQGMQLSLAQSRTTTAIPLDWLLLDSGSTISSVCNKHLISNLKPITTPLTVYTNGGSQTYSFTGTLNVFPLEVYYDGSSIANILSLSKVCEKFRVTMDSGSEHAITVHLTDTHFMKFTRCSSGLYFYDTRGSDTILPRLPYSLLTTVRANKEFFSPREIERADKARLLQSQLAWPSTSDFKTYVRDNLLLNCPITIEDISRAEAIYGPQVPILRGKKVRRSLNEFTSMPRIFVPPDIIKHHPTDEIDLHFFFVNSNPFLHTKTKTIKFRAVQSQTGRGKVETYKALKKIIATIEMSGIRVIGVNGDNEFEKLREFLTPIQVNIAGRDQHISRIERDIRLIEERLRCFISAMPYKRITKLLLSSLIEYIITCLNNFPDKGGVSKTVSPAAIVLGREKPNCANLTIVPGAYAEIKEQTTNTMKYRSTGAIALRPSNNRGGYYFQSLSTGRRVHVPGKAAWTELPIPDHVITRFEELAKAEGQPIMNDRVPLFEWSPGIPLVDDDDDRAANRDEEDTTEDNELPPVINYGKTLTRDDVVTHDNPPELVENDMAPDDIGAGANNSSDDNFPDITDDTCLEPSVSIDNNLHNDDVLANDVGNTDGTHSGKDEDQDGDIEPGANESTDVDNGDKDAELGATRVDDNVPDHLMNDKEERVDQPKDLNRRSTRTITKPCRLNISQTSGKTYQSTAHQHMQHTIPNPTKESSRTSELKEHDINNHYKVAVDVMLTQMTANKGIKNFGERAVAAILKEYGQLNKLSVFGSLDPDSLSHEEKRKALRAINLIKQKRCGKIKARTCADGRPQRSYVPRDEAASPTVSMEALLTTLAIDAKEKRDVAVFDVPSAYLHAEMPASKKVLIKLEDKFVDIMCQVNPRYLPYVRTENKKKVLYLRVLKALYGCIESAPLWYNTYTSVLQKMGFELNRVDPCVANKVINGKQCTITWYVDDNKISHEDPSVVTDILSKMEALYPGLTVSRGKKHKLLGMDIEFCDNGSLKIDTSEYVREAVEDFGEDVRKKVTSPAAHGLFQIDLESPPLSKKKSDVFHSVVAKLLWVMKRGRPDIETTIAFLCTRVKCPTCQDWCKLRRLISFLYDTIDDNRIIGADNLLTLLTWIDAAYAVHNNMRSHTGGAISMGLGVLHARSSKQRLNTKSSTEAEVVGVSDYLPYNLHFVMFLREQGYTVRKNVLFQDNESAIKMETNGRMSCTSNSKHVDVRYFFVKDRVDKREIEIRHCPTTKMVADYFTKPLQGALFHKLRRIIMGWDHLTALEDKDHVSASEERVVELSNGESTENKKVSWVDIVKGERS